MLNQTITSNNLENSLPENLFLIVGGRTDSPQTTFDGSDAFFAKRIPKTAIARVVKKTEWIEGVYDVWTDEITSTDKKYYVLNTNNDTVYICIKNNPYGRVDLSGSYISTIAPNHTNGLQAYSDGYTWLALFKLDYTQPLFETNTEIPVPYFGVNKVHSTLTNQYQEDCPSGATTFGCCCLYYTTNYKDPFSGITYAAGSLTDQTIFSTCSECSDLSQILDKQKVFLSGITAGGITTSHQAYNPLCPSTVDVQTLQTTIKNNLDYINENSTNRFQYDAIVNHLPIERGILAATINLGDLPPVQRRINKANPLVNVVDPSGSGAEIQLITQPVSTGVYEITGIQVLNPGTNYTFPSFSIDGYESSSLNDTINVYVYPDKLFENPSIMIPSTSLVVKAEITDSEIRNTVINTGFTKVALAKNLIDTTSNTETKYAFGDSTIYKLQTKVLAKKTDDDGGISSTYFVQPEATLVVPEMGEIENITKNSYKAYVSSIKNTDGRIFDGINWKEGWELAVNDIIGSFSVNDELVIDGVSHTVISVEEPVVNKQKINYYSTTPVNIQLAPTPVNRTYSVVLKLDT